VTLLTLPLVGEVDALAERGGWGHSLHSTIFSVEAPPPQPSPASGRGAKSVRRYLFLFTGLRFSMNAAMPSARSCSAKVE
jgi:hypothetical protein